MSTTFDLPICPNTLEGSYRCAKSDVFISRETDDVYVIQCRTCRGINVFPKDKSENKGRYQAGLAVEARHQRERDEEKRTRAYSFSSK